VWGVGATVSGCLLPITYYLLPIPYSLLDRIVI